MVQLQSVRWIAPLLLTLSLVTQAHAQTSGVTRAEAAMFLLQSSKQEIPTPRGGGQVFPDVPSGSWQERYLQAAVQRGMLEPNGKTGEITPSAPVSRGEYLWMLAMLFGLPHGSPHHFSDIPPEAPYAPYVGHAERCGLFKLPEKNRFLQPSEPLTHVEAALALQSLFRCFPTLKPPTQLEIPVLTTPTPIAPPLSSPFSAPSLLRPIIATPTKTEQRKLQVIALTNKEREAAGLLPLVRNALLEQAAQAHAKDMYKRGYFSHFTPEGLNYVDRVRVVNYLTLPSALCPCRAIFDLSELLRERSETSPHYVVTKRAPVCNCTPRFALGENIARGQQTAEIAVEQWMASPSHRQAILQSLFRETGVGVFGDVWVQIFGSLSLE